MSSLNEMIKQRLIPFLQSEFSEINIDDSSQFIEFFFQNTNGKIDVIFENQKFSPYLTKNNDFYIDISKYESCFECGNPATEWHHVIPKVRGGSKTLPLCTSCHMMVHNLQGSKRADDHIQNTIIGQQAYRANGGKLGAANENYGQGENFEYNKAMGIERRAKTRNANVINDPKTKKFAEVVRLNIQALADLSYTSEERPDGLFFLSWRRFYCRLTGADYTKIHCDLQRLYPDEFGNDTRAKVVARFNNLITSISNYNRLNND